MKRRNNAQEGKKAVRSPRRAAVRSMRTRSLLVEVAGLLFAERGFDGATGHEICRRAGLHTAAIVYHFDSMEGLYRAVLDEAQRRSPWVVLETG